MHRTGTVCMHGGEKEEAGRDWLRNIASETQYNFWGNARVTWKSMGCCNWVWRACYQGNWELFLGFLVKEFKNGLIVKLKDNYIRVWENKSELKSITLQTRDSEKALPFTLAMEVREAESHFALMILETPHGWKKKHKYPCVVFIRLEKSLPVGNVIQIHLIGNIQPWTVRHVCNGQLWAIHKQNTSYLHSVAFHVFG